jgi:hypothetical protein
LKGCQVILSKSRTRQASVKIKNIEIYVFTDWAGNCSLQPACETLNKHLERAWMLEQSKPKEVFHYFEKLTNWTSPAFSAKKPETTLTNR